MVKVTENKIKGVEDTPDDSKESKEPESKKRRRNKTSKCEKTEDHVASQKNPSEHASKSSHPPPAKLDVSI